MKILLIILYYLFVISYLQSNDANISISYLKVMKRNKPTCDRLGNVYDACQWMLKFKINNNTTNDLTSFCSVIKINKGKYKLCGNKAKKKFHTAANESTIVLTNLSKLIGYDNNNPKPDVKILSLKGKFAKF